MTNSMTKKLSTKALVTHADDKLTIDADNGAISIYAPSQWVHLKKTELAEFIRVLEEMSAETESA